MIWAKLSWFNKNIITRKIKLNSMLDFIDFWTLYFRWPMWVNVCILVKGLFESEWFPWGREQMKCKNFSLVKTTLVILIVNYSHFIWSCNRHGYGQCTILCISSEPENSSNIWQKIYGFTYLILQFPDVILDWFTIDIYKLL